MIITHVRAVQPDAGSRTGWLARNDWTDSGAD